jgi:hypothetical protein
VCDAFCEAAVLAGFPEQLLAVGTAQAGAHRSLSLLGLAAIADGVAIRSRPDNQLSGPSPAAGRLAPSAETDGAIGRLAGMSTQ